MFLANCLGKGPWLPKCSYCIPVGVAEITTLVYNVIRIAVPLVLIFVGMFDMAKAITKKSEDEVKKAQQLLVRKAISGFLVFFLMSGVLWLLQILNYEGSTENTIACIEGLFNYEECSGEECEGYTKGSTDPDNICVSKGYSGVLKIICPNNAENCDGYYYACYKHVSTFSSCNNGASEMTCGNPSRCYEFNDGNQYCVNINKIKGYGIVNAQVIVGAECKDSNDLYQIYDGKTLCAPKQ